MATKRTKKTESKTEPKFDFIRKIDHALGHYHPKFIWSRVVQMVNKEGQPTYTAQMMTESHSVINIVFDVTEGKMFLVRKPRYNVVTPSDEVDEMRRKAAREMDALLKENAELQKKGELPNPVPTIGSMMDALEGPLAAHRGDYADWEVPRGWDPEKFGEGAQETGKKVDHANSIHIGDVNCNTALFTTYLPIYITPIIPDEDYDGDEPDDIGEILGAEAFGPEELRDIINGTKGARDGMICGLSLAALQRFTMWALEYRKDGDPYNEFAASL